MNNFLLLDNNRIASARQVYAVACKFANIQAKTPSERYGLKKVFNAVVNKFYSDQDAHMTHGEVTDFLGHDVVPKQFLDLVRKPKAVKKSKVQTVQQAEIALDINKPKAKAKKSTVENSVAKKLDNRVNALETKVSDIDSKLDAMLKILQAK
tara:strand:- start:447 stop:902 length:456 start_codon:yes stop_codon:yes gene_type:complete